MKRRKFLQGLLAAPAAAIAGIALAKVPVPQATLPYTVVENPNARLMASLEEEALSYEGAIPKAWYPHKGLHGQVEKPDIEIVSQTAHEAIEAQRYKGHPIDFSEVPEALDSKAVTTDEGLTNFLDKLWAEDSKIEKPDVDLVSQSAHDSGLYMVRKGDITSEELVQYGTNVLNAYLETKPI